LQAQVIVVGIEHGHERKNRRNNSLKKTYGGGKADDYLEFIVKILKYK
jgi:alpha-glucosidase